MNIRNGIRQAWLGLTSRSSTQYWERRYRAGMDSGPGSYGELAAYKARFLNDFVERHSVRSVIEFGCGDGRQLSLSKYPKYLGFDVSRTAVDLCLARFAGDTTKSFMWYDPARTSNLAGFVQAELTMSLDVIYHLLEDRAYDAYLRDLFGTSSRFVVVYSSDKDDAGTAPHVRHRKFTNDVAERMPRFRLTERLTNPHHDQTFADFYVFELAKTAG